MLLQVGKAGWLVSASRERARPTPAARGARYPMAIRFGFSWPPPPPAPLAPVVHSPPPSPFHLANRSADVILECEFFEGMDLTTTSGMGPTVDVVSSTQQDCCNLCAKRAGCESFVFMPDSAACLLMPPGSRIQKIPNPSTVGGQVHISSPADHVAVVHFSGCRYETGSGYTGGAITAAAQPVASAGGHTATKQDCCDACAQVPSCAKFVFEVYSGMCQLFAPIAERYNVQGLVSGTMTSRNAASLGLANVSFNDFELQEVNNVAMALNYPPIPPTLLTANYPPPSSPPDDQQLASDVLADVSLIVGSVMLLMVLLCAYLVLSVQIMSWLHRCSNGKLGRLPKALLPEMNVDPDARQQTRSRKLLGHNQREPGVLKVTVQTVQLTQKKELQVGACETLAELRDVIWDEFRHLLGKLRIQGTVLLCYHPNNNDVSPWLLVTEASNMQRVIACEALKLVEKTLVANETFEAAFALSLRGPEDKNGEGKGRHKSRCKKNRRKEGPGGAKGRLDGEDEDAEEKLLLVNDDVPPDEVAADETPLQVNDVAPDRMNGADSSAVDDDPEPEPPAKSRFLPLTKPKWQAEGEESSPRQRDIDPFEHHPPSAARKARPRPTLPCAADNDTEIGSAMALETAPRPPVCAAAPTSAQPVEEDGFDDASSTGFLGKHVRIVGLVSQPRLNGRRGVASRFDSNRRRYLVRLDEIDGHAEVVAFRPDNLVLSDLLEAPGFVGFGV
jgi:hypothetical protein